MLFNNILLTLLSFGFTFIISFPFIGLLYKWNIRRLGKVDLDKILKHRTEMKLGTPIMGGFVIIFSILLFTTVFLRSWEYFWLVIIMAAYGAIVGAIDEYLNTLGRTFNALRALQNNDASFSLIPVKNPFYKKLKKIVLLPWKIFEEFVRIIGSEQRGMKNHQKLLLQFSLAAVPCLFFYFTGFETTIRFPLYGPVDFGYFYYIVLFMTLMVFANAFGVTDGMDGLSAGLHTVSFLALGIIAAYFNYKYVAYLSFVIVGAELAFLYFNIFPARMEMSDVGTFPLGMMLVLIAFLIKAEFALLFVGLIYLIEIFTSMTQQWSVKLTKKRLYPMAPIHHAFEYLGWPETKVTMRFWLVNSVFCLFGILIALL